MPTSARRNIAILTGLVALAVPAVVIAAPGFLGTSVSRQITWWTDETASVNDTSFRAVPDMGNQPNGPPCAGTAVAVSADMSQGQAMVRVVDESGDVAEPGPVLFSARGSNAFNFVTGTLNDALTVQWKRSGDQRAIAQNFSAHAIGVADCG